MTGLADAIARLREAAGAGGPDGPLDSDGSWTSFVRVEREPSVVSAVPDEALTTGELEAILGAAKRLPRNPSGGARTVLFTDTLPADGESGATVLAEIDDDDRVLRLLIRPDSY